MSLGVHLCGGIKIVFSQVNGLVEKGHRLQVLSPVKGQDWFSLKAEIKADIDALQQSSF